MNSFKKKKKPVTKKSPLPIIVIVTNTTTQRLTATLWGAALNSFEPNFGNSPGIEIKSGNVMISYRELLSATLSMSMKCSHVRLINTANTAQVQQSWTLLSKNIEGQRTQTPMPTSASFSPFQQQSGIIDLIYPVSIDSLSTIEFEMLPGPSNTLTIYFYPSRKVSSVYTLFSGKNVCEYESPSNPTVFNAAPISHFGLNSFKPTFWAKLCSKLKVLLNRLETALKRKPISSPKAEEEKTS